MVDLSPLTLEELEALAGRKRDEVRESRAQLDPPAKARRRSIKLLVSGSVIVAGIAATPLTGWSALLAIASGGVFLSDLMEDNAIYVGDLRSRQDLRRLRAEQQLIRQEIERRARTNTEGPS